MRKRKQGSVQINVEQNRRREKLCCVKYCIFLGTMDETPGTASVNRKKRKGSLTPENSKSKTKRGSRKPKKRVSVKATVLTSPWGRVTRARAKRDAAGASARPATCACGEVPFINQNPKPKLSKYKKGKTDPESDRLKNPTCKQPNSSLTTSAKPPANKGLLIPYSSSEEPDTSPEGRNSQLDPSAVEVGRSDPRRDYVGPHESPQGIIPQSCMQDDNEHEVEALLCPIRDLTVEDYGNETESDSVSQGVTARDLHDVMEDSFEWTPADQYDMTLPGEYEDDQSHRERKNIPDWATGDEFVKTLFLQQPELLEKMQQTFFPPCPTKCVPFPEYFHGANQ